MTRTARHAFRLSLRLYPSSFRRVYADEMELVFAERIRGARPGRLLLRTLAEVADVGLSALRARSAAFSLPAPLTIGALTAAALATVLTLQTGSLPLGARYLTVADSVHFNAEDPAGRFTLLVRYGRPVAATIDSVPVPSDRLVQEGDSIRVLAPAGGVVLAVAYYRDTGRIEWEARPSSCRGRAPSCVIGP